MSASHRFDNALRRRAETHPAQTALTPAYLLDPIHVDLGGVIGLDPCTTPDNPTGALAWYAPPTDGAVEAWDAVSVYCNPPYGEARERWVDRCIRMGRYTEGADDPADSGSDRHADLAACRRVGECPRVRAWPGQVRGAPGQRAPGGRIAPVQLDRLEHQPFRMCRRPRGARLDRPDWRAVPMTPELAHAIEQAVWYPYNTLPQQPGETVHAWIVRAVIATLEPTLAELDAARPVVEAARAFNQAAAVDGFDGCHVSFGAAFVVAVNAYNRHTEHTGQVLA